MGGRAYVSACLLVFCLFFFFSKGKLIVLFFFLKQDTDSRHDFLNHGVPISAGRKQLPYLALKGAIAFPADTEIQNIESIQERETVEEENSAKFPIGRRDFDSKYILFFSLFFFLD